MKWIRFAACLSLVFCGAMSGLPALGEPAPQALDQRTPLPLPCKLPAADRR